MDACQRTVTLASGVNVTLTAWGLGWIAQNSSDYFRVLAYYADALRGLIEQDEAPLSPIYGPMLERVIRGSLLNPEDAAHVRAPDIAPLMVAICELNGLEVTLTKMAGLLTARTGQQAETSSPTT